MALDRLVEKHDLGSLAYFAESVPGHDNEDTISSIILGNSLLTARGVPVAGEYEIKNAQAMKIMDAFGAGGSFTEYYAMDFDDDVVLMGHDGPGHIGIAQGKTKVRPLEVYHGKVGRGLSVEMSVQHGPVTLLSVVESGSRLKLLVAEGESVPGPILEIGNTNSRYRFSVGRAALRGSLERPGPRPPLRRRRGPPGRAPAQARRAAEAGSRAGVLSGGPQNPAEQRPARVRFRP